MKRSVGLLLNALLFQVGWFACVLGARHPALLLIAATCLALHLRFVADPREGRLIVGVSLCGWALDSLLLNLGLFDFHSRHWVLPGWQALLWPVFAMTLRHALAWSASPWWRASLAGALGGPLSYWAGVRLAGVGLPLGTVPTLAILALVWAILLPLLHRLDALGLKTHP